MVPFLLRFLGFGKVVGCDKISMQVAKFGFV